MKFIKTFSVLTLLAPLPTLAFIAPTSLSTTKSDSLATASSAAFIHRQFASSPQLRALPLDGFDAHAAETTIRHILDTSSTILSDASVAAAEDKVGWWDSYLNIYKASLLTVHSTIDQPLKNSGWDQTWGVSIAAFTAIVRSALLPLSIQQTKSTEYIKALKPYQDEIKEKFKDNKEMQNKATAKLFEDANANPLAGCLISILQLPILIGLYRSITLLAMDGELQEPFLWIPSLEGPVSAPAYRGIEWLTQGWFDGHPSMGWETTLAFLIMPVVLVLGQGLTMKVLTPEQDTSKMSAEEKEQTEKTQGVLKFLPLLIGYFSLQVPAGLTIYWFTSNVYSLCQALVIRGYYEANPPDIELPDYWDALDDVAKMSPEERRKAAEAGMAVGPKWQDILDEANFHYVVERKPLRENSAAWERVKMEAKEDGVDVNIPTEMLAWVESSITTAASDGKILVDTDTDISSSTNSTEKETVNA